MKPQVLTLLLSLCFFSNIAGTSKPSATNAIEALTQKLTQKNLDYAQLAEYLLLAENYFAINREVSPELYAGFLRRASDLPVAKDIQETLKQEASALDKLPGTFDSSEAAERYLQELTQAPYSENRFAQLRVFKALVLRERQRDVENPVWSYLLGMAAFEIDSTGEIFLRDFLRRSKTPDPQKRQRAFEMIGKILKADDPQAGAIEVANALREFNFDLY